MRYSRLVGGLLAVVGLWASACTSAAAPASETLSALDIMDSVGFHTIDEALAKPGASIDPSWLGKTRNARIAVAATTWPREVEAQAKAFVTASGELQAALEKDDVAAAAKPARAAHEAQHALSHEAYTLLAKRAGLDHAAEGGH